MTSRNDVDDGKNGNDQLQKSDAVQISSEKDLQSLTRNFSTLLNQTDMSEILQIQGRIMDNLEKADEKSSSCLNLSKTYQEKYGQMFKDYTDKCRECQKLMESIGGRLRRLEEARRAGEEPAEPEPETEQDVTENTDQALNSNTCVDVPETGSRAVLERP